MFKDLEDFIQSAWYDFGVYYNGKSWEDGPTYLCLPFQATEDFGL